MNVSAAEGWQVKEFKCSTAEGRRPVAGWVRGLFGIDFRAIIDRNPNQSTWCGAWAITHLPTGLGIIAIRGPFQWAADLADEFAAMPVRWSMTQPAVFQHARHQVVSAIDRNFHLDDRVLCSATVAPFDYDVAMVAPGGANDHSIGRVR